MFYGSGAAVLARALAVLCDGGGDLGAAVVPFGVGDGVVLGLLEALVLEVVLRGAVGGVGHVKGLGGDEVGDVLVAFGGLGVGVGLAGLEGGAILGEMCGLVLCVVLG